MLSPRFEVALNFYGKLLEQVDGE